MAPRMTTKLLQSKDGTTIYAEAVGNADGPGIVFVHGLSMCSIVFNGIFADERLLREFYLIRYDLRGHGRSGKPEALESHPSSAYAEDYMAVVHAFGLKKTIHVGWSLGATISADLCQNIDPIPISGLVYLSALPYIGEIMPKISYPLMDEFRPKLITDDLNVYRELSVTFVDSVFVAPDKVPFETRCAMYGSSLLQSQKSMQCAIMRSQDPTKLLEAGSKGLPLLVVNGTEDRQVIGENLVKELKPHFRDMEVVTVEEAGHAVFLDKPDEVVTALVNFARRVST